MAESIVDHTVNSTQHQKYRRDWRPEVIGASAFLDGIADDVVRVKRPDTLSRRHVYAVDPDSPGRGELGLIGQRCTADALVFYGDCPLPGDTGREYFEAFVWRDGAGWMMEATSGAPADLVRWMT